MLFKVINRLWKRIIASTIVIYIILSFTIVAQAEIYEWTVINSTDTIETNAKTNDADNINENSENNTKDTLNLECESAILIEQNSRPSTIRKKRPRDAPPSKCNKTNEHFANIRSPRKPAK